MELLLTGLGLAPLIAIRPLLSVIAGAVVLGFILCLQQGREPTLQNIVLSLVAMVLAAVLESLVKAARRKMEEVVDEVRHLLSRVERVLTTCLGMIFMAVMLGHWGQDALLELFTSLPAPNALQPAAAAFSVSPDVLILAAVGAGIWCFSGLRTHLTDALAILPWSADPWIRRVYAPLEMGAALLGVAAAIIWPVVGGVLFVTFAIAGAAVFFALRGFEARQRTACAACDVSVHRCAQQCPACAAPRVPMKLGVFGRALQTEATDAEAHRLRLLGARRCPHCAEVLVEQGAAATCRECGARAFGDAAALNTFVSWADRRWLALVPVLAALGLLPLLGAILGIWLYRLSPAGAVAAFAPWRGRLLSQVLRGMGWVAIVIFQPIPLAGAIVVPLFVGVLHAQARRTLRSDGGQGQPEPVAALPSPGAV